MTETKHTRGDWQVTYTPKYGLVILATNTDRSGWRSTVPVVSLNSGLGISVTEADARLIAAAPDLLAACEGLLHNMQQHHCATGCHIEKAREVVAKASATRKETA